MISSTLSLFSLFLWKHYPFSFKLLLPTPSNARHRRSRYPESDHKLLQGVPQPLNQPLYSSTSSKGEKKKKKKMSSLEHHFFDVLERHTPWYWRYRIQRVHRSSLRAMFAVETRHGFWPFGFDPFLPLGSLWPYSGYKIFLLLSFHYNSYLSHFILLHTSI